MSTSTALQLSQFALDVAEGLSRPGQKKLSPRYFYDDLGSSLFEAITLLPEYGLTRAGERLLKSHAGDILSATGPLTAVAELGSGSGNQNTAYSESSAPLRRSDHLLSHRCLRGGFDDVRTAEFRSHNRNPDL